MAKIELDLDQDMCIDNGKLNVKINPDNDLVLKSDGLYVPRGQGSTGTMYYSNDDCVEISNKTVNVSSNIHRVFTALDDDGVFLSDYRDDIDYITPGDMYRVKKGNMYDWYLIVQTSAMTPGNHIERKVLLGRW